MVSPAGGNETCVAGTKKNELRLEGCEDKMSSNALIWFLFSFFKKKKKDSNILLTSAGHVLLLLAIWFSIHFWQYGIL